MPSRLRPALVGLIGAFRRTPACATAAAASLFGLLLVAACSTEGVMAMRPDVDVGAQTAAVPAPVPDVAIASAAPLPGPGLAPADPVLAPAEQTLDDQAAMLTPAPPLAPAAEPLLDTGPEEPVPDLVPEDAPIEVAPPPALPEPRAPARRQTLAPEKPTLAAYPRFQVPDLARPQAMPGDEVACRRELKRLGVTFSELPPIREGASCGIAHPIKVSALSGRIAIKPAATLNCEMAVALARWSRNELAPAARYRYMSGIKTIHQGSSYSCRKINGTHTTSEHAHGNAIDIMRIELKNGRDIDVRKPGWFAFRQRGFLNTVRSDGCGYFTTVLGPGYNWDHRNHFHFDIKPRRNGRRACR